MVHSIQPVPKPNPLALRSVIGTTLTLIGTGATIVGGGILLSFYKLSIDDDSTRLAAGIVPIVIGAIFIIIGLIIGVMDGYDWYHWWKYNKTVEQSDQPQAVDDKPDVSLPVDRSSYSATDVSDAHSYQASQV